MDPYIYCKILYNSQDIEATQVSIDRQIDKENVVHNGLLLDHKKNEILPLATTWMDLGVFMSS